MMTPLLFWLAGCGGSTEAPSVSHDGPAAGQIEVIYQTRVDGEIEPCG